MHRRDVPEQRTIDGSVANEATMKSDDEAHDTALAIHTQARYSQIDKARTSLRPLTPSTAAAPSWTCGRAAAIAGNTLAGLVPWSWRCTGKTPSVFPTFPGTGAFFPRFTLSYPYNRSTRGGMA